VIRVARREPNFRCRLEDIEGVVFEELHAAASAQELAAELDRRVKSGRLGAVLAIDPYDFASWQKRAQAAVEKAKEDYPPLHKTGKGPLFSFSEKLWGELKSHLQTLFHDKCAYCEASFRDVAWGDVEHFRPKRKVTDDKNAPILLSDGSGLPHPGYFWLAYDPENFLPSCQLCNQAPAKLNQFPVQGARASAPGDDLEAEKAVLLNPYRDGDDDPRHHLRFVPSREGVSFGTVVGVTEKGKISVRVYRLNREMLIEKRRAAQDAIRNELKTALVMEDSQRLVTIWRECSEGTRPFSSALRVEVESYLERMGLRFDFQAAADQQAGKGAGAAP